MKKKKVVKYRGSKTHGGGAMKKRRGAGNRGGRGNAGSGKRGDAKKQTYQKMGIKPGKHGFKCHSARKKTKVINVGELDRFVKNGHDGKELNLTSLGYTKLLGSGQTSVNAAITVPFATEKAVNKVKAAGGSVKLPAETVKE